MVLLDSRENKKQKKYNIYIYVHYLKKLARIGNNRPIPDDVHLTPHSTKKSPVGRLSLSGLSMNSMYIARQPAKELMACLLSKIKHSTEIAGCLIEL